MRLYDFTKSSAAYRVRIALALKGVEAEVETIAFKDDQQRSARYLDVAPSGLVPALTDGDLTIGQSLAICRYLDARHPEPLFYREEPAEDALVSSMALDIACDVHPLNNLRVLKYLRGPLGQDEPAVMAWYAHWITLGFEGLERQVARYGSDRHCFGEAVSIADVCLVPQVFNARRFDVPLDAFPRLVAIDAALREHEAFSATAPVMH